jgi:peptidoglycan/xylan/chitin deacetylase (PgdA/CDA1 family)
LCGSRHKAPAPPEVGFIQPQVAMTSEFAVPVLMYHRIDYLTPKESRSPLLRDLTVSPDDFDAQLRYLAENGFSIISAEQVQQALRTGAPLPEKCVAITMDDGYRDNFEQAFPILRKYGVGGTVFVVTSVVGDERHLTWDDMRLMLSGSMQFGSHTVHHYDLTALPLASLDFELVQSRKTIESALGTGVTDVAYPSGMYNDVVAARTRAAGYEAGWKKGGGPVRPGDDPYLLPRVRVHGKTDMADFRRKVWSGYEMMRQARG